MSLNPPPFKLTTKQDRARDVLISDAVHTALGGGARSGKTFLLLRQVFTRALKAPGSRHAVFRFRFNSVKTSIILDTLPKMLKLCFPQLPSVDSMLNKTDYYVKLPNDSEVWFSGLDDKERVEKVLGKEYVTMYFNECSEIPWASIVLARTRNAQKVTFENRKGDTVLMKPRFFYDFNPPSKMHWTYINFVEKRDPTDNQPLPDKTKYAYFPINPIDNVENLADGYMDELSALPEKARKRFRDGLFADDTEGALWTVETLAQNRHLGRADQPIPELVRIAVAVDPSGSSGPADTRSDEIGIVVGGVGTDGHGYLLEDLSGRYRPEEWGKIAVSAYDRHQADYICGEINFGGDMVRSTIQAHESASGLPVPFQEVHASRGKVVRAEPISVLYDQAKIHHVGYFPELEDQMCATLASGYIGLKSPDRMDSNVWLWTSLFPGLTQPSKKKVWRPGEVQSRKRSASRYAR